VTTPRPTMLLTFLRSLFAQLFIVGVVSSCRASVSGIVIMIPRLSGGYEG